MTRFLKWLGGRAWLPAGLMFLFCVLLWQPLTAGAQEAGQTHEDNRIVSISVDRNEGQVVVNIKTAIPLGYRYTVYDSASPARITVDFPGMDMSAISSPIQVGSSPLQMIRTSSLDLTSGKLGRVELILTGETDYKVTLADNNLAIAIPQRTPVPAAEVTEKKPEPAAASTGGGEKNSAAVVPAVTEEAPPVNSAPSAAEAVEQAPVGPATVVESVKLNNGSAIMKADGRIEKVRSFELGAPPRLVVDLFGVRPAFQQRSFKASSGFKRIRVGSYNDKTRFVFDAEGEVPSHAVKEEPSAVAVSWGDGVKEAAPMPSPPGAAVTVKDVKFHVENGQSVVSVVLSGSAETIAPTLKGDTVNFGIRNANISRDLRRTIDASAFPSAVRLVTPYTVQVDGKQDVRFAVQLKGPVPYSFKKEGNTIKFVVEDGPFAEVAPPKVQKAEVPVPAPARAAEKKAPVTMATAAAPPVFPSTVEKSELVESMARQPKYSGEKISLVFDDADIRRILQLIGEVSGLNIIAGEDVKGTITLRLVDVPWDQALSLILETKGLGMLKEGNVVRVLPIEKIRQRRQAELTAAKEERALVPLVTEVIGISYTDLANVAGPGRELLTDRGKITEDPRNKQIIVTDVPSAIQDVKKLVSILDTPERQVMIEARIVEADSSFTRDLGVKWGLTYNSDSSTWGDPSNAGLGLGGDFVISPPAAGGIASAGLGSSITFGRVGIDSTILDLQISALETSGHGKIVSTPRVSTLNGGEATISQGTKIPYQSSGDNGLPKTEFVDANLELKVKPVINPDNSIILDITATNSSQGSDVPVGNGAAPTVNTKEAKTKLLVRDGDTTVIGGIFVENENQREIGVPFLMHLPLLGHLFKSASNTSTRSELLIFITPRIVN
jgi:type IV pilus assembly protein PilQ